MRKSGLAKIRKNISKMSISEKLKCDFSTTLSALGLQPNSSVVIGVSGGTDSMALASLCANWSIKSGVKCLAVIIDHGLRTESSKQACQTQNTLEKLNIQSKIIKISSTPPDGNIQHWARTQRLHLLMSEARKLKGVLMLAHHLDDQLETFYMRLLHNSGLFGLAGIKSFRIHKDICIIRPLLNCRKTQLHSYCVENHIDIIEDPSNQYVKFDRVRARNHLSVDTELANQLSKLNILLKKITIPFQSYCDRWCDKYITVHLPLYATFPIDEFVKIPELMKIHIFRQLLWQIGARDYPASINSTNIALSYIGDRRKFTLAGCVVILKRNQLEIHAERKRDCDKTFRIEANTPAIIDNRWFIKTNKPVIIGSMTNERYQVAMQQEVQSFLIKKWSYPARLCIPIIQDLDGRVVQPHIEVVGLQNDFYRDKINCTSSHGVILSAIRNRPFWKEQSR